MTRTKRAKALRKPRPFKRGSYDYVRIWDAFTDIGSGKRIGACTEVVMSELNTKQCRKLAAWLLKAADYLEQREVQKKPTPRSE